MSAVTSRNPVRPRTVWRISMPDYPRTRTGYCVDQKDDTGSHIVVLLVVPFLPSI
jgi:hypothetical protein